MKDYLADCIDSVLNQKFKNIEIILINDSTSDPVCEIMRDYWHRYSGCITLDIKDSNLLCGGARNRGLMLAKGEFISFVDGDDWLDENMFDTMMPYFNNDKVDMVICDFKEYQSQNNTTCVRPRCSLPEGVFQPYRTGDLFKKTNYAWNAIFRRSLMDRTGFNFFEKTLYEDLAVHFLFVQSRLIAYIPFPFYTHRKHDGEITNLASSEQHCSIIKVVEMLTDIFRKNVNMSKWGQKFNDLLIDYLFHYMHFLMIRGSVEMNEEILKLCSDTFLQCGGVVPERLQNGSLIDIQLKSPHTAMELLVDLKERGKISL